MTFFNSSRLETSIPGSRHWTGRHSPDSGWPARHFPVWRIQDQDGVESGRRGFDRDAEVQVEVWPGQVVLVVLAQSGCSKSERGLWSIWIVIFYETFYFTRIVMRCDVICLNVMTCVEIDCDVLWCHVLFCLVMFVIRLCCNVICSDKLWWHVFCNKVVL